MDTSYSTYRIKNNYLLTLHFFFRSGVNAKDVSVIPNAVDAVQFRPKVRPDKTGRKPNIPGRQNDQPGKRAATQNSDKGLINGDCSNPLRERSQEPEDKSFRTEDTPDTPCNTSTLETTILDPPCSSKGRRRNRTITIVIGSRLVYRNGGFKLLRIFWSDIYSERICKNLFGSH